MQFLNFPANPINPNLLSLTLFLNSFFKVIYQLNSFFIRKTNVKWITFQCQIKSNDYSNKILNQPNFLILKIE